MIIYMIISILFIWIKNYIHANANYNGVSGTIEEATEVISWKLLDIHKKDIIIFNYENYWDNLIKMYDLAKDKKFGKKNLQNICKHVDNFEQFSQLFSQWKK